MLPALLSAQTYDIVLQNGRVMDPESGLDAVRSVGITGNKIAAVSARPLRGKVEVDARKLVIAPGFIDLHQHSQTNTDYGFKAMDGVTTALELEVGVFPVSEWYAARQGKSIINFGASSGHIPARMKIMHDSGGLLPRDAAMNRPATPEEQKAVASAVEKGLDEGGLGMGMGIVYTPTASPDEILNLFYLAAKFKRPVFVHMRATGNVVSALQEVITDAAVSGAPLHVVHINSSSTAKTPEALRMIEGARARGLDVTTEAYPYTAGMTEIASARYAGLENQPDSYFASMLWPPTGETADARILPALSQAGRVRGAIQQHGGNGADGNRESHRDDRQRRHQRASSLGRHVCAGAGKICAAGEGAHADGCDSEVFVDAGAAPGKDVDPDAPEGPREGGRRCGPGGLRPGYGHR